MGFTIFQIFLVLMAARAASTEYLRGYFSIGIASLLAAALLLTAGKFFLLFPSRILDLIVIVMTLGLGLRLAMLGVDAWHMSSRTASNNLNHLPVYIVACASVATLLMFGAAIGLKYCYHLKLNSNIERAGAVFSGMLLIPSICAFFALPLTLAILSGLSKSPKLPRDGTNVSELIIALSWLLAIAIAINNARLIIKMTALKTEIAAQESKWKE